MVKYVLIILYFKKKIMVSYRGSSFILPSALWKRGFSIAYCSSSYIMEDEILN
jgi:hypothetical protein